MLENVSLSQQRRNSFANSHLREVRSRKPVYFRTLKCDMSEVETAEATKGFLQSSLLKPQKIHLLNNPGNSLCSPLSTKCSLLSLGNSTHRSDPYCSSRISLGWTLSPNLPNLILLAPQNPPTSQSPTNTPQVVVAGSYCAICQIIADEATISVIWKCM